MKIISVKTPSRKYEIVIGYNIVNHLGRLLKKLNIAESIFIVSSPRIYNLYGERVYKAIKKCGIEDIGIALFQDNEENKSYQTYINLIGKLIDFDAGKEKKITVVALGGGVVGDVAGFIAGTYRRGVSLVHLPTTLLAMVDSSIGGKTGIDFKWQDKTIKNILGGFYQPNLVLTDLSFLDTLSRVDIYHGLSEIIKYGVIKDRNLFEYIEKNTKKIVQLNPKVLLQLVYWCCDIKCQVVEQDERETKGIRTILNFGHTIGHAVEGATNFKFSHSDAVAFGMVCEAEIANMLGLIDIKIVNRIENLIKKFHLPTEIRNCKLLKIIEILHYDKKFHSGKNLFVLPVRIGKVVLKTDINEEIIRTVLTKRMICQN
ncbi:MAG: 3-dehydroquinate synthase [Elusimicrobiota bacterium]|nr:3-dehydroquinate synthase [Elusimicrobiota bacterium]